MLKEKRVKRHHGIRKYLRGSKDQPRLAVFRSAQHIYAQIIDDSSHKTLVAASDLSGKEAPGAMKGTKRERALKVGEELAKKAKVKKISRVVFDRGGFKYHGRIAAVAEGARKGGLQF